MKDDNKMQNRPLAGLTQKWHHIIQMGTIRAVYIEGTKQEFIEDESKNTLVASTCFKLR